MIIEAFFDHFLAIKVGTPKTIVANSSRYLRVHPPRASEIDEPKLIALLSLHFLLLQVTTFVVVLILSMIQTMS